MNYEYKVKAKRVIDGDTVECTLQYIANTDVGFRMQVRSVFEVTMPLRLARINAPEMDTLDGQLAKAHMVYLCEELIRVVTFKPDKYGRWLADLYNAKDECINDLMVEDGYAKYTKP